MAIENADLETDLFYAQHDHVYRRGLVEVDPSSNEPTGRETVETFVCVTFHEEIGTAPEGTAEQIARALNRLPKLERFLIDVAGAIREGDEKRLNVLADEIEELIVNG